MLEGRRVLVVVPARGGSKGVKLKNLRPLGGVSLVAIAGHVVQKLPFVDHAIVSTDHVEIAQVAASAGLDAPFLRPEALSGDRIADWDVLVHALQEAEKSDGVQYDVVVMLQPTSPSRRPEHVEATVRRLIEGDLDSVWTVSETDSKGHPLKQLVIRPDGSFDYYDPAGANIIARQQLTPVYHRNGIAYAMTRECLLAQRTIKGKRTGAVVIEERVINIDTEFDLQFAEWLTGLS